MDEQPQTLSYGQKAVGLDFNPSGDPNVQRIKELYAEIIDLCNQARDDAAALGERGEERARHFSVAITNAETAQMRAVKAITWED